MVEGSSDDLYALPVFTPLGSHIPFMQLYSFFDPRTLAVTSLAEYLLFGGLLWVWLVRKPLATLWPKSGRASDAA